MGNVLKSVFGQTTQGRTTNRTFSAPRSIAGRGTQGVLGQPSLSFDGSTGSVNLPAGISELRQGIRDRTNLITGDVQNDIQGLRQLENPFVRARVRPTEERFANARASAERGLARRGVFGTLSNNELFRLDEAGAREIADQGAKATAESQDAILQRQKFEQSLNEQLRNLTEDEVQQAINELKLLGSAAGTSFSSVRETTSETDEERQGDASKGIGTALETLTDLLGLGKGFLDGSSGGILSDIGDIFGGDGGGGSEGSALSKLKDLFSGTPSNITDAPLFSGFGNAAGAANISAVGGGSLSAASQLGGGAASRALATGGVDSFGAFGGGTSGGTTAGGAFNLGSVAGAAIPLGIAAFGASQIASGNAKQAAAFAPILSAMKAGPVTTLNGVTGRQFTHDGQTFLAPMRVDSVPEGTGERILYDVYNTSTGEWGSLGSEGFSSDAAAAGQHTDGKARAPVAVATAGPNIGRPIFNQQGFGLTGLPNDQVAEWLRDKNVPDDGPDDDLG